MCSESLTEPNQPKPVVVTTLDGKKYVTSPYKPGSWNGLYGRRDPEFPTGPYKNDGNINIKLSYDPVPLLS